MHIPFRNDILEVPICRGSGGAPMTYHSLDFQVKRAGIGAGFQKTPGCYWLRRGAANALNGTVTGPELRLIMGHSTEAVFNRRYLSRTIRADTQSAFLGNTPADETFQLLKRIERNPLAPLELTPERREKVLKDPGLLHMQSELKRIKEELTEKDKHVIGRTKLFDVRDDLTYITLYHEVEATKRRLLREAFEQQRKEFFQIASSNEIRHQLESNGTLNNSVASPREYDSAEQEKVMEGVYSCSSSSYPRPEILNDLVQFCINDNRASKENPTINLVAPPEPKAVGLGDIGMADIPIDPRLLDDISTDPSLITSTKPIGSSKAKHAISKNCPFCEGKKAEVPFSSPSNLRKHVRNLHLKKQIARLASEEQVRCPGKGCTAMYPEFEKLKGHIHLSHGVQL